MRGADEQIRWEKWTKDYGSIIGLKLGPQNVVVLNDSKHVKEYENYLFRNDTSQD